MGKKDRCVNINGNQVKGLLVGINYRGTPNQLGGCINDINAMSKLITSTYPNAQLDIMTDDTIEKPTRANILAKLKNLVDNATAGDILIFNYSGHGSQVQDIHGDEEDGLDETICPIDFMTRRIIEYKGKKYVVDNQITNDEINEIITKVPKNAKFFMLSDSCHSGTIGHLKNDLANYTGANIWDNKPNSESSQTSVPTEPQTNDATVTQSNLSLASNYLSSDLEVVASVPLPTTVAPMVEYPGRASWIYIPNKNNPQIWLLPQNYDIYQKFHSRKHIINAANWSHIPQALKDHSSRPYSCFTVFKQQNSNQFIVDAPELGVKNLKIDLLPPNYVKSRSIDPAIIDEPNFTPTLVVLPNGEQVVCSHDVTSIYDEESGEHCHMNHTTGNKNTFQMRCAGGCAAGELRIISGCEENQTSADTGRNGACTLAFLDTVKKLGSLDKLFIRLFSHNIQDLKLIQDNINSFLIKFGFTQHSIVSWDHSNSTRSLYLPGSFSSVEPLENVNHLYGNNLTVINTPMFEMIRKNSAPIEGIMDNEIVANPVEVEQVVYSI